MFNSGIKASDLIGQIKSEADIAIPIEDESYISWLNALEQLLYTECIKEQGKIELDGVRTCSVIGIDELGVSGMRFEDIYTVYAVYTHRQMQLTLSTVASGAIFSGTYYKVGDGIGFNLEQVPNEIKIIYFVKPELKTPDNIDTLNVMIPVEFIDLAKAKLRGEAYKVANEGELAAMWINDYNVLLETFKAWLSGKQPEFGM